MDKKKRILTAVAIASVLSMASSMTAYAVNEDTLTDPAETESAVQTPAEEEAVEKE